MAAQPNSSDARKLAVVLHDLSWLLPRTISPEAESDLDRLPLSELEVMRLLVRRPGQSVGDVARELGLRDSNASAAVRALIARGLVERQHDVADGRLTRLLPTERAVLIRRRREDAWGKALRKRLAALPAADAAALADAVPSLRALAGILGSNPPAAGA